MTHTLDYLLMTKTEPREERARFQSGIDHQEQGAEWNPIPDLIDSQADLTMVTQMSGEIDDMLARMETPHQIWNR